MGESLNLLLSGLGPLPPSALPLMLAFVAVALWLLARRLDQSGDDAPLVVVDGSNVMHWAGDGAELTSIVQVIAHLKAQGYQTAIVFDANVGYKLEDKFIGSRELARKLGLSSDAVVVVDKGQPADRLILQVARELGAKVVSNDRFREWADDFPEVMEAGRVMRGGIAQDGPYLALSEQKETPAQRLRRGAMGKA